MKQSLDTPKYLTFRVRYCLILCLVKKSIAGEVLHSKHGNQINIYMFLIYNSQTVLSDTVLVVVLVFSSPQVNDQRKGWILFTS